MTTEVELTAVQLAALRKVDQALALLVRAHKAGVFSDHKTPSLQLESALKDLASTGAIPGSMTNLYERSISAPYSSYYTFMTCSKNLVGRLWAIEAARVRRLQKEDQTSRIAMQTICVAVRALPASERSRYAEEFQAVLSELPSRRRQIGYSFGIFARIVNLRYVIAENVARSGEVQRKRDFPDTTPA